MAIAFADLGVPADLGAVLRKRGITSPFPIQAATLPDALAGRDVSGRAPTGSGKTIAFALAIAARTRKPVPHRPRALVLAPTRELARQIEQELSPLVAARGGRVAAVYGGTGYGPQCRALAKGVSVVVGCPGRLEDLIQRGDVRLDDVNLVVVDEADRMADMGFLPAVRRLLDRTAPDRQTLLFSATLDGQVDTLVRRYQRDPFRHEVAEEESSGDVEHMFRTVGRAGRVDATVELIVEHGSAIVFCRTRHGADRVARQLASAGVESAVLHGSRTQAQRERGLAAFRAGRVQALVATDVVARGIHVDAVPCVVHFDPAADAKDYLHRSGRTGRAGASGTVVSLVTDDTADAVRSLQRALGVASDRPRTKRPDNKHRNRGARPRTTARARTPRNSKRSRSAG
jgi:superfamily II DNA/RNA helicase